MVMCTQAAKALLHLPFRSNPEELDPEHLFRNVQLCGGRVSVVLSSKLPVGDERNGEMERAREVAYHCISTGCARMQAKPKTQTM